MGALIVYFWINTRVHSNTSFICRSYVPGSFYLLSICSTLYLDVNSYSYIVSSFIKYHNLHSRFFALMLKEFYAVSRLKWSLFFDKFIVTYLQWLNLKLERCGEYIFYKENANCGALNLGSFSFFLWFNVRQLQ